MGSVVDHRKITCLDGPVCDIGVLRIAVQHILEFALNILVGDGAVGDLEDDVLIVREFELRGDGEGRRKGQGSIGMMSSILGGPGIDDPEVLLFGRLIQGVLHHALLQFRRDLLAKAFLNDGSGDLAGAESANACLAAEGPDDLLALLPELVGGDFDAERGRTIGLPFDGNFHRDSAGIRPVAGAER